MYSENSIIAFATTDATFLKKDVLKGAEEILPIFAQQKIAFYCRRSPSLETAADNLIVSLRSLCFWPIEPATPQHSNPKAISAH